MKKIFSLLTAGFLALGLMGCSGLHDAEGIDMSQLSITGNFNNWALPGIPLEDNGDGTYCAEFTATSETTEFCIITGDAWNRGDYRGTAKGELADIKLGESIDLYPLNTLPCAPVHETKVGTTYTVTVTPQTGYLTTLIEEGVIPPSFYIISETSMLKMEIDSPGIYVSRITATDTEYSFKVFDGDKIFGAKSADANLDLNKEITLTSATGLESITVKELVKSRDYVITVKYDGTAIKVKVEPDLFKAFIIGDMRSEFARMTNLTDKLISYTFTYSAASMNAWGGSNGTISFIVNDRAGWSDYTKYFKDVTLTLNENYVASGSNDENNAKVENLVDGHKYTILIDVNDERNIKAKIIDGDPLFIAGGMNNWIFEMMDNDVQGAYFTLKDEADSTEFKVSSAPNWDATVFGGVEVTSSEKVKSGELGPGSDNGKVTAKQGDKLYVAYDYEQKAYVAWVESVGE